LKIALVLERFDIQRGGAERSTYEMACCLHDLGHAVSILAGKINRRQADAVPFDLVEIPHNGFSRAARWHSFCHGLEQYLQNSDFDIVHSIVPVMCADVYQPRGGSLVHSQRRHALSFGNPLLSKWKLLTAGLNRGRAARIASERRLCLAANGPLLAALSDYVAEQFRALYGMNESRIRLVRNGVRPQRLLTDSARSEGDLLRRKYDDLDNRTLFLYVSQNFRLKGLEWLLNAAKQTRGLYRILVASAENPDPYRARVKDMGLDENVIFLGQVADIAPYYHACDAVVLPTFNDACSRGIMEGLATGNPCITTRFDGSSEFLEGGRYGIVLDECNHIAALTEALEIMMNTTRRLVFKEAIIEDGICDKVSMARHVRELVTLFERIASQKNSAHG
jgi:UDP-glucose:(heptosyl)LPS alpha-1,3-glucosyltransferase